MFQGFQFGKIDLDNLAAGLLDLFPHEPFSPCPMAKTLKASGEMDGLSEDEDWLEVGGCHTCDMEKGRETHQNGALVQAELERQLAADDAYDSQAICLRIDG